MLARFQLCLSEFHYQIIHRAGIKNQTADTVSRNKTGGEDFADINDDLSVGDIDLNEDKSETVEASLYIPCHVCVLKKVELVRVTPEVQALVQQNDPTWDS